MSTYAQIEDYPYYIDQTMLGWFQEINGVQKLSINHQIPPSFSEGRDLNFQS